MKSDRALSSEAASSKRADVGAETECGLLKGKWEGRKASASQNEKSLTASECSDSERGGDA